MPRDGELCYEEPFNSFLAGVLLKRKMEAEKAKIPSDVRINIFDFLAMINDFEELYDVTVINSDMDISIPIYVSSKEIRISSNLDDMVLVNGKRRTIKNYLYSLTTPRVRDFLKIGSLNVEKKENLFFRKLLKRYC